MKALILSAGLGTRLLPYSAVTPKPMFTLAGRPLLDLHIRMLADVGCEAIAVNTHHRHEAIEDFVNRQSYPIPVSLRHEPLLLGTGGAIKNLADFWDDRPFMVINADIFHDFDLASIYEFHCRHPHPVSLVLWDDATFNSVTVDQQHRVIAFPGQPSNQLGPHRRLRTFTGIQVLDPLILDFMTAGRSSHSIDAYGAMMAAGHTIMAYQARRRLLDGPRHPATLSRNGPDMAAKSGFAAALPDIDPGQIVLNRSQVTAQIARGFVCVRRAYADPVRSRATRAAGNRGSGCLCVHRQPSEKAAAAGPADSLPRLDLPAWWYWKIWAIMPSADSGASVLRRRAGSPLVPAHHCRPGRAVPGRHPRISDPAGHTSPKTTIASLILEKECRYFVDAFLNGHLDLSVDFKLLEPEFESAGGPGPRACPYRLYAPRHAVAQYHGEPGTSFTSSTFRPVAEDLSSTIWHRCCWILTSTCRKRSRPNCSMMRPI